MSWASLKTEGVVLQVAPVFESDRNYAILTADYGKIRVTGRGAQKMQAKLASHLEPFGIVSLEVIRGRRSTTVIAVDGLHRYRAFTTSLERRLLASTSLALVNRYTHEDEHDPGLYQFVLDWLSFLDQEGDLTITRATYLLGGFLLKFMKRLGYEVALRECLHCHNEIMPLSFRWHGGKGGLICTDCAKKDEREWFSATRIDEEVITLLRVSRDQGFSDALLPALKKEHIESHAKVVHDLMMLHLPGLERAPFWEGLLASVGLDIPKQSR